MEFWCNVEVNIVFFMQMFVFVKDFLVEGFGCVSVFEDLFVCIFECIQVVVFIVVYLNVYDLIISVCIIYSFVKDVVWDYHVVDILFNRIQVFVKCIEAYENVIIMNDFVDVWESFVFVYCVVYVFREFMSILFYYMIFICFVCQFVQSVLRDQNIVFSDCFVSYECYVEFMIIYVVIIF